jgi:hypothetical protein
LVHSHRSHFPSRFWLLHCFPLSSLFVCLVTYFLHISSTEFILQYQLLSLKMYCITRIR